MGDTPITSQTDGLLKSIEELPALSIGLLPHQEEAVRFALNRSSAYLALDMGLGKTATAIAIIAASKIDGKSPALVVVPPSLRETWRKEFEKFAPFLKVHIITGRRTYKLPPADVYVIGDSIISDWSLDITEDPYTLVGFIRTLVVDEAHRAKTPTAVRTKAIIRLANSVTTTKVLLSGTPTPNGRNYEMGAQIDILGQDAWDAIGGKGKFFNYFCPVERDGNGKLNKYGKRANVDSLGLNSLMIDSFMMRMRRDEVLELPNKGRSALHIVGKGKPVKDYLLAEESLIAYLAKEGKDWRAASRNEALVQLTTMRKLAGECKVDGIIEYVRELLDETLSKDKGVFIVAEHYAVMEPLVEKLEKYGVALYNGSCDDAQKAQAVEDFNSGKARVFVGQIKSAGVGLTLHGDGRNHHVIMCQLPWSPADLTQAEDRLHRIGQINDVHIDICLASIGGSWTIDERLWGILEQKAFSAGEIIDGKGEFLLEEVQDTIIDSYR
jgi:SWI/SNF-related matrix-associated actin-dependent regulator 1 of chromatin subfamily A